MHFSKHPDLKKKKKKKKDRPTGPPNFQAKRANLYFLGLIQGQILQQNISKIIITLKKYNIKIKKKKRKKNSVVYSRNKDFVCDKVQCVQFQVGSGVMSRSVVVVVHVCQYVSLHTTTYVLWEQVYIQVSIERPVKCALMSLSTLNHTDCLQINNCVFTFASEFRQNNARPLRF